MNLPYFLYMAENEGILDIVNTREAKINAAVRLFQDYARNGYNINDARIQASIFDEVGINPETLSTLEIKTLCNRVQMNC